MSNQEVVDFVRAGVAEDKTLEKICEEMMDHCLADDQTSSGLGYDNMSVMVIGILNGKTENEWYQSIKEKAGGKSSSSSADTKSDESSKDTTPSTSATSATDKE